MYQIPVVFQMEGVDTLDTPQTRAQCCNKEKPAERELLTAGVEGVDTLDAHFKKPIARQNKKYLLFSLLVFITF